MVKTIIEHTLLRLMVGEPEAEKVFIMLDMLKNFERTGSFYRR